MAARTQPAEILRSWKEIASYLGRDVRTVIRWEKEKGLPIRRPPGIKRAGTVFADRRELDAWLMGSSAVALDDPPVSPQATAFPKLVTKKLTAIAGALLVVFVLAALWAGALTKPRALALPLHFVRTEYVPGTEPTGLIAADFNNDGVNDLVVSNSAGNSIAVLPGRRDGTFGAPVISPVDTPGYFVVGDFDGDGHKDLAVHSRKPDSSFHVLLGDGTGRLREASSIPASGRNKGMAAADLNHDGKTDIVVVRALTRLLTVLLGNGDGTFRVVADLAMPTMPGPVTIADLNGDGNADIAVADYDAATGNTVTVMLGNGDGTFPVRNSYRCGGGPLHIAAADINEDGKLDLVTANYRAGISVLIGAGDGSFRAAQEYPAGKANTYVAITDLDEDGHLDILALGMHDDALVYLRGHGNGKFDPPQKYSTGRYPDVIALGDFDRDGHQDLAVTNSWANSVSVYLNRTQQRSRWAIWSRRR